MKGNLRAGFRFGFMSLERQMHRDKKVGLALGILLIGTVGAFFFRNDAESELVVPTLDDPEQVDQMVDEIDRPRPYPAADVVTLQRTEGGSAGSQNPSAGIPAIDIEVNNDAWIEPDDPSFVAEDSYPKGPPDPISINREQFEMDLDSRPIPRQDPNASWSTLPASTDRDVWSEDPSINPETSLQQPAPREYKVRPGDTLSGIAQNVLGSSGKFLQIYDLNRDRMKSPNDLTIGMTLRLPRSSDGQPTDSRSPIANQPDRDSRTRIIPSSSVNTSPTPLDSIVDRPSDRPSIFGGTESASPFSENPVNEPDPGRSTSESAPGSRFVPFRRSPFNPGSSTRAPSSSVRPGSNRTSDSQDELNQGRPSERSSRRGTEKRVSPEGRRADPNEGWDSVHQKSPSELMESLARRRTQSSDHDIALRPEREPVFADEAAAKTDHRIAVRDNGRGSVRPGSAVSSKGTRYIVRNGDSLERIALRFYGDSAAVGRIRKANPDTDDEISPLNPGTKLILP